MVKITYKGETRNIPKSYLEDYGDWFKFTSAMKTLNKFELWQSTCKKNKGYDENKNIKNIEL